MTVVDLSSRDEGEKILSVNFEGKTHMVKEDKRGQKDFTTSSLPAEIRTTSKPQQRSLRANWAREENISCWNSLSPLTTWLRQVGCLFTSFLKEEGFNLSSKTIWGFLIGLMNVRFDLFLR